MSVARWLKKVERKQYTCSRISKSSPIVETRKETILVNPIISVCQLRKTIETVLGVTVSKELIRIAIKKQGYTFKKVKYYGEFELLDSRFYHETKAVFA